MEAEYQAYLSPNNTNYRVFSIVSILKLNIYTLWSKVMDEVKMYVYYNMVINIYIFFPQVI